MLHPLMFDAPAQGNQSEFLDETYPAKTRGMGLLYGENCTIPTSTILGWWTRVTDWHIARSACCRTLKSNFYQLPTRRCP